MSESYDRTQTLIHSHHNSGIRLREWEWMSRFQHRLRNQTNIDLRLAVGLRTEGIDWPGELRAGSDPVAGREELIRILRRDHDRRRVTGGDHAEEAK